MNELQIKNELLSFIEWTEEKLSRELKNRSLFEIFNEHCEKYAEYKTAKEIVDEFQHTSFLIDTPDGFQEIGDFYVKHKRNIHHVIFENYQIKVSSDHLLETKSGFKHTKNLKNGDEILTKLGFIPIISNDIVSFEEVYDWEVLHKNHRYWCDGVSSHNTGKTFLALNLCRGAQKKGYHIIYCDTEAAVDEKQFRKFGLDPEKVRYQPVNTPAEFKFFVSNLLKQLKDARAAGKQVPKIMMVLDSLGNLATSKERNDALEGKEKRDMTKQQELRSLFRIITMDLAEAKIPFVLTNHSYAAVGAYVPTDVFAGGGGALYNSSFIAFLYKAQLKEDKPKDDENSDVDMKATGIVVRSKPHKSRFAKPIQIRFHISFFKGMNPYVGLEDFISWKNCGIEKGNLVSKSEYEKLTPGDKAKADVFEFNGKTMYFVPKASAMRYIVKHLGDGVKANQLFTPEVFTEEALRELDEKVIKPTFMLPDVNDIYEIDDYVDEELEETEENLIED